MVFSRRDFLKAGIGSFAYLSAATTVPMWLAKTAHGLSTGIPDDRILVLIQMSGGNDGLNTVIPIEDDWYMGDTFRARTHIYEGFNPLGDGLNALHPRMGNLANWYQDGYMAVLQNVGYPNANQSHFLSSSYYEFGASPGSAQAPVGQGWISRFFDNECEGVPLDQIEPLSILAANTYGLPESLSGSDFYIAPRANDLGSFRIRTGSDLRTPYVTALNRLNTPTEDLDFIQRIENVAEGAVAAFMTANETEDLRGYSYGSLGRGLRNVSKVIRSGAPTKIFYVSQGGYDTHSGQTDSYPNNGAHANLLQEFNDAVHAFLLDMQDSGNLDKVLMLTFSEFGRRVEENGSMGTDHGGAGCMMAFGGGVTAGIYGGQPDLRPESLDNGNLVHTIDFRSVYANVIEEWFNGDAASVFGADFTDPTLGIASGMAASNFVNTTGGNQVPPNLATGCAG